MLTQSRVSVAPILGRRRLKEGGGVTDTHATTTNYPCTTTESLLEHELDNQQLNQWAFRMSQKFNTVSTAFALSRGLHPKGSHNFELVRKILLIKEKDLNNVVLKLQKKKKEEERFGSLQVVLDVSTNFRTLAEMYALFRVQFRTP